MPQAPTWEETVAVPSWEDTVDESQAPESPKETEQEFVQRMGKPIVPTKAQLNEPRSPKELFEPFKKIPRVDSSDPRFRAAVSGALGQPASEDALSSVAAILNSAAGFAEGIESPAGVATAFAGPLGKVAQKLAALGWGAYSAAQVPEAARTAGELSVTGTPQEEKEAYLGLAGSIAIPAAIGAGVVGESPARGLAREISQAVPKFEDTSPIPITERGERAPLPTDRVKELISKAEPILPKAAKEAAVSVEEQARLQKELAEELGQEPAVDQTVPAIKTMSGEVVAGEKGQSHNDIIEQNKIPAKEVDRREFVDTATGQEVSREKLATAIPTKKEGEAHSSDLAKAQEPPPEPAVAPKMQAVKDRIAALKSEMQPLADKGGLTKAEAERFRALNQELNSLRYDAAKPLTLERIPSESERQSTLPKDVVLVARNDLMRNKDVYTPIVDSATGVFFNADTPIDDIVNGKNPTVSYQQLYDAFNATREALRKKFGDAITLYRSVGQQKSKSTTNWATTKEYAEQFGGNVKSKQVPIDDIVAVNVGIGGKYHEVIVRERPPTPAPVKAEPSGAKEPWQMTKAEWAEETRKKLAPTNAELKSKGFSGEIEPKMDAHYWTVKHAIERGKPVPPEVLTDYPDLKPSAPPPPAQPKGETPKPQSHTDNSVQDHSQQAKVSGNTITVTAKVGRQKVGSYTIPLDEWLKTDKGPSANPNWNKAKLVEKYASKLKWDDTPEGDSLKQRILDSQRYAIEKAIAKSKPEPSPSVPTEPTPPPVEQKGVEPGSPLPPGFQGPGAARVGDVPAAPPQAIAAGAKVEQAPPESRPMGFASTLGVAINNARQAIRGLGTTLKGFAGATMPKTTARDRLLGEAGARYLSSRIAARPLAASFSARVLQDTNVDPFKFGAALTEDNLRSVRESLRQKATELTAEGKTAEADLMTQKADDVKTIIGSKGSPFADEEAYFDFLDQPNTKKAIAQHLQLWKEVIDPQYKEAQGIDPDVELPSRGQQTGARINLKAVLPDQPATKPVMGSSSGLTATFKRKSPFGIKAKGTGQAYDVDYHSIIRNTFERQLEIANKNAFDRMLEQTGNAVVDKPGRTIDIGGEPAVAFPLSRKIIIATGEEGPKSFSQAKNIYVRKELADEYRAASNVDRRYRWPVITPIMNGLNRAALAGLTDATVHVSNQMTALFNRPTSGKFWTDTLLSATGRADVPVTLVRTILKAFKDNQLQEAELAKIGAMRQQGDIHYGVFGRVLQHTDKLTRLVLDDTFKGLVKEGLVENTETARREYVNQIGQYNRRAQGLITRAARDIGFGPFVTAGKTFNALGVRMAILSPGAPAANGFAAAALRANVLSKWIGGAVVVGTMNYLITGKMMGRPGTPLGNIDTGKNDKSGKQLSLPFLSLLGLGRGLRVTGAKGAIDAKRMGLTDSDAIDAATRDIINSWTSPFAGPPVKFGLIAATGYQPAVNVGRASRVVPPGESQFNQNVGDAIRQSSPVIQTYIKAREGKSVPEILSTQVPRFTMQPGKSESMVANYPKIVSMAQGAAFIDDMIHEARRMDPDKRRQFVIEQVRRLPPAQWDHAFREVARRRVYK